MEPIKHEHKKQLHDKIEERTTQLKTSLLALQGNPDSAKSGRARAVGDALAALQSHLSGGWDTVDESESAALVRWLESSQFLFDEPPMIAPVVAPATES
jgi:hypothetical protein